MSHSPVFTKRCCKLVRDHFPDRRGPREASPRQAWPVDYAWAAWNGAELLLIFQNYVTDVLLQPLTADKSRHRIELNPHFLGPKRLVKTLPGAGLWQGRLPCLRSSNVTYCVTRQSQHRSGAEGRLATQATTEW
jgi:hypothetical protein